jgi:hypothetical protein
MWTRFPFQALRLPLIQHIVPGHAGGKEGAGSGCHLCKPCCPAAPLRCPQQTSQSTA